MDQKRIAQIILRVALVSVFLYAATGSYLAPDNWIGYFPLFLRNMVPQQMLLNGFSIYEVALSVWLLSGKKIFYAAVLSAMTLSGILVFNLALLDIIFRDFAIMLSALALASLSYKE